MFNKGTDHRNDVMMAQFVFFLSDSPRTSKIVDFFSKYQIDNNVHGLYF